jgi:hypothetical protein
LPDRRPRRGGQWMDHRAVVDPGDVAHPDGQLLAGPSPGPRPLEDGVQPSPLVVGRPHLDQGAGWVAGRGGSRCRAASGWSGGCGGDPGAPSRRRSAPCPTGGCGRGGVGTGGPHGELNRMTRNPRRSQKPTRKLQTWPPDREALGCSRDGYRRVGAHRRAHPMPTGGASGHRGSASCRDRVQRDGGQPTDRPPGSGSPQDPPGPGPGGQGLLLGRDPHRADCPRDQGPIPSKANEITGRAHRGSKGGQPGFDQAACRTATSSRPPSTGSTRAER